MRTGVDDGTHLSGGAHVTMMVVVGGGGWRGGGGRRDFSGDVRTFFRRVTYSLQRHERQRWSLSGENDCQTVRVQALCRKA